MNSDYINVYIHVYTYKYVISTTCIKQHIKESHRSLTDYSYKTITLATTTSSTLTTQCHDVIS